MKYFFYLILFLPTFCFSLTTAELKARTKFYLKDPSKPSVSYNRLFGNSELLKLLNDCQYEMVSFTLPLISSYSFTTTSGTYEYNLPDSYIAIDRVTYNEKSIDEVTVAGLDENNEDWNNTTGLPTKYYIRISTIAIFGVSPTPLTSSTYTVNIWYYSQANDLVNNSDIPFNGYKQYYSFHSSLVYCAAAKAWMILGDANASKFYNDLYLLFLQRMNDWKSLMPNFNPAMRGDRGK